MLGEGRDNGGGDGFVTRPTRDLASERDGTKVDREEDEENEQAEEEEDREDDKDADEREEKERDKERPDEEERECPPVPKEGVEGEPE